MINRLISYLRIHVKNREFLRKYKSLEKTQRLSFSENQERSYAKLNKILTHAYLNVPYYKNLFDELSIVEDNKVILKDISDLKKIPFLTKDIIRREKHLLYSIDKDNRLTFSNSSGGSTGQPVHFLQDAQYAMSNRLNTQLAYSWRGMGLYDDMVVIWGAERDIFDGKKSFKNRLLDFYYNRTVLNSFSMSEDDMRYYIGFLNKKRPKLIKAYAQSIYELAKFAKKNKIEVKAQQAIHLAAGTVYESMRELIEEVFQCKAYNYYGSREVGSIASECKAQDGLHIMQEHTFVEIVNSEGKECKPGEQGEVVVTTLENYSMPLIRYKIGDVAVKKEYSECSCGCTYPKLEKVIGRTTDLFKTKDGKKIDGEYFTHLFYFRDWIEKFQVVQNSLDSINIKIVKSSEIVESDILDITNKIKMVMGKDCKVIFEYPLEIAKTPTGKFRYTISNI